MMTAAFDPGRALAIFERTWAAWLGDELQHAAQRCSVPIHGRNAVDAEAHCDAPQARHVHRRSGQGIAQQCGCPSVPCCLGACRINNIDFMPALALSLPHMLWSFAELRAQSSETSRAHISGTKDTS